MSERLKRVCAWCQLVMDDGSPGAMITHGMCDACYAIEKQTAREEREVADAEWAEHQQNDIPGQEK